MGYPWTPPDPLVYPLQGPAVLGEGVPASLCSVCSRKADLEQSDGEEDFYYTELDVDVDALTDGLSSLTPVSPTSSVPPAFPGPEAPPPPALPILDLALASPCSPPAPPGLCHVHTDHAYQVRSTGMEGDRDGGE